MDLDCPITDVKGVGSQVAAKLSVLGISTVGELLDFYPRRYDDYSNLITISQLQPGQTSIKAKITNSSGRYSRRGLHITEAVASDDTGSVRLVWFNQPYRANSIRQGEEYFISGNYELSRQRFALMNPSIELAGDIAVNTARILAIYRETKGLTSRQIRKIVAEVINSRPHIEESLPSWLVGGQKLISRQAAIESLHRPDTIDELTNARYRLGFEEVFYLTLASLLNKLANQANTAPSIMFNQKLAQKFVKTLPFKLTDAQRKAVWQIYLDIAKEQPMNRLIEGDVGSGKTVVAAMAALMALDQGFQVALMAPTELLARQHANTIFDLLKTLGLEDRAVLLVGSMTAKQKNTAHRAIADGRAGFIIGTHALIQDKVDMHNLALIIIDEQHRFGVEQRKTLMKKAGHMPHVLSLTATPIPRSLALTLYGELDISVLDQKPTGRKAIETRLVSLNERQKIYQQIDKFIDSGRQVYVVCPLINASDSLGARSVDEVYKELSNKIYPNRRIGLLHGQLPADQKNQIMSDFINRKIDILVSTTVIEVGVDVPNASVMLIESSERFGLAQLHQLRGRVGRGQHQSHCYLFTDDDAAPSKRLRALESSNDGFKLAELDLEIRGPGAIYGSMQHGQLDLRIAKLSDSKLIAAARNAAQEFIDREEKLVKYKELHKIILKLQAVTNLN